MEQDIRKALEDINTCCNIKDEIALAKKLIQTTNILWSENASCQFLDDQDYTDENKFITLLNFKRATASNSKFKDIDGDVSLLSIVMYSLLDGKIPDETICYQQVGQKKYQIVISGQTFRGDTLTSAIFNIKKYLGFLWLDIGENSQRLAEKRYRNFYHLFCKLSKPYNIPIAPNGMWYEYCLEHCDVIWSAMDECVKNFLKNYTSFGNYMCIPGNTYNKKSFNTERAFWGKQDTADALFARIYAYYQTKDSSYLHDIFATKKEPLVADTLKWLNQYKDWKGFVDKNVLAAYVDKNLVPISLKTGDPIKICEIKEYVATPTTYKEFLIFFEQLSKRIPLRAKEIYKRITKISSIDLSQ